NQSKILLPQTKPTTFVLLTSLPAARSQASSSSSSISVTVAYSINSYTYSRHPHCQTKPSPCFAPTAPPQPRVVFLSSAAASHHFPGRTTAAFPQPRNHLGVVSQPQGVVVWINSKLGGWWRSWILGRWMEAGGGVNGDWLNVAAASRFSRCWLLC
ncbi:hypothetical protein AKJ16_DCAP10199, partial [Drosera capensis]